MVGKGKKREEMQQLEQVKELELGALDLGGGGQGGPGWEIHGKKADFASVGEQMEEQKMWKKHAWVRSKTELELVVGFDRGKAEQCSEWGWDLLAQYFDT